MQEYAKHPRSSDHPDEVILVACSHGYLVTDQQKVFGRTAHSSYETSIVVEARKEWAEPEDAGVCYAITAKYLGKRAYCIDIWPGSCATGNGNTVHVLTFKKNGAISELTDPEYRTMKYYARHSRYSYTPD